ncbi:MAG: DUF4292 domain-containing protein [Prevotella sp.]|nr:DUF4292 domain-containing protein [Prevotella sp.]
MKPSRIMKLAALALPLILVACGTQKKAVKDVKTTTPTEMKSQQFLQKVNDNAQYTKFITSKVKFSVEVGNQQLTLTGNLKMKRDDVIRLQLMAFGFVEAGRLEFTKDYVLIMDRINKQFIKASYTQLDFMRNSGLNFYSLQSLFWNELFQPGKSKVSDALLSNYQTDLFGEDAIISMENGKLSYRWLADKEGALIKMANIMYEDKIRGNYQLNWDYEDFRANGKKQFPHAHKIQFNTPDKAIKMGMTLNYLGNDEEWETRTEISGKYREVTVDEILRRFMAL